jgi:hypothetical protein
LFLIRFTNAVFTIIGALISGAVGYFAARSTWRNVQFNEAASRFSEAFVSEIIALRKGREDVYRILTDEVLLQHERATVIFEPYLSKSDRELLQEAWRAYATATRTTAPGNIGNRKPECEAAIVQIERLLSFATQR